MAKPSADARVPELIDWGVWRLLTHPQLRVTLAEFRNSWTLRDYIEAHIALDSIDLREFQAYKRTKTNNDRS